MAADPVGSRPSDSRTARAVGYFLTPCRAGEAVLAYEYAQISTHGLGSSKCVTSVSRTPGTAPAEAIRVNMVR